MRTLAAVGLAILISACAGTEAGQSGGDLTGATSSPEISEGPAGSVEPAAVREALLERMQEPAVSFHVESRTDMAITEDGELSGVTVESALDVAGDDYAGTVITRSAGIDDQTVEVVSAGERQFVKTDPGGWIEVPTPPSSVPANRFRDLDTTDLTFLGMTDEGLFEFDIRVWTGGDPTTYPVDWETVDIETAFELGAHRTRLTVDSEGRPHRLTLEFAISLLATGLPGEVTTVEEYSRVGEPVQIEPPDSPSARK